MALRCWLVGHDWGWNHVRETMSPLVRKHVYRCRRCPARKYLRETKITGVQIKNGSGGGKWRR